MPPSSSRPSSTTPSASLLSSRRGGGRRRGSMGETRVRRQRGRSRDSLHASPSSRSSRSAPLHSAALEAQTVSGLPRLDHRPPRGRGDRGASYLDLAMRSTLLPTPTRRACAVSLRSRRGFSKAALFKKTRRNLLTSALPRRRDERNDVTPFVTSWYCTQGRSRGRDSACRPTRGARSPSSHSSSRPRQPGLSTL